MVLARFQRTVVDDAGNILDGATVTVTDEATGLLATLYSDRAGLTQIGNPIFSDLNGFAAFYVTGGAYRIDAVKASDSVTWRYVGIGTAQELDATDIAATVQQVNAGFALAFEVETTAPPSSGRVRFNNADLSAATIAYVSVTNLGSSNVQALLTGLYSASRTRKDRFTLEDAANNTIASFQIDGASAVGSPVTHVALTISGHTGETSFADDTILNFQPSLSGVDGADGTDGIFDGTEATVTAASGDLIPLQDVSDSNNPKRSTAKNIANNSDFVLSMMAFDTTQDVATGNSAGNLFFRVPAALDGFTISSVEAHHAPGGAGSGGSGTTTIQIGSTNGDVLSTLLTIDANETSSSSAATPAVIKSDGTEIVNTDDFIRVDVDAIPSGGTLPVGLIVHMTLSAP